MRIGLLPVLWIKMMKVYQAETDEDRTYIRELFWEYLQWANFKINEEFEFTFDIEQMLEGDMLDLDKFYPPHGRLLLVKMDDKVAGLACMRRIREDIGEIKRMYVRKEYRGLGIGRTLLERLIDEAKKLGYPKIRLDSARFMEAAHSLYQSNGFYEIEAYPESEIPDEFKAHWIFMEKEL
jgi:GNAT superfamily N-acetyltransferase